MVFIQECDLQTGTFVYQVICTDGVHVTHQPAKGPEFHYYELEYEELVAVDAILHMDLDTTYLRLADQSGWLPEMVKGHVYMKPVPIRKGLWTFYVDNYPVGQAIRRHPMDTTDSLKTEKHIILLPPMQRIYCDVQVKHPVTDVYFYRLQSCGGWVYDRRPASTPEDDDVYFLLKEDLVQTGLFCYQAWTHVGIRNRPNVSEGSMTQAVIRQGELVAVDIIRQSPYQRGNGPFLRVTDGSGWVFQHKHNLEVMRPVPVEVGWWEFRVVNLPGLGLRRRPVDSQDPMDMFTDTVFKYQSLLQCDRKVTCEMGEEGEVVAFYRVQGTQGWVMDRRKGVKLLELLSEGLGGSIIRQQLQAMETPWKPDFVRGIAATVPGVLEVSCQIATRTMSFRTREGIEIIVFYGTRTVLTLLQHDLRGKVEHITRNCTPSQLVGIFQTDLMELLMAESAEEKKEEDCEEDNFVRLEHKHEEVEIMHADETNGDDGDDDDRILPSDMSNDSELLASKATSKNRGPLDNDWRREEEKEARLRNDLLSLETELAVLQEKRHAILAQIKALDDKRGWIARQQRDETLLRWEETNPQKEGEGGEDDDVDDENDDEPVEKSSTALGKLERERELNKQNIQNVLSGVLSVGSTPSVASPAQMSTSLLSATSRHTLTPHRSPAKYICKECGQAFPGRYSRDLHMRESHRLVCQHCDKTFLSFAELDGHRDTEGHW